MIKRYDHPKGAEDGFWKLVRNAARCNVCGDYIESGNRHDFRTCKCGNVSVDGGHSYVRRAFQQSVNFTDDCEWQLLPEEELKRKIDYYAEQSKRGGMGFYVDYVKVGEVLLKEFYGQPV
jgi:hypothetical protein